MRYFLIVFLPILLFGCSTVERQIVASNDDFIVLQTDNNDTFGSLAEEFLGGKQYTEILERYNPQTTISSGSYIAIPKKVINSSGVFVDGYQRVPVLCYHQFTEDSKSKNKMVVPRADFEQQMDYLASNGYKVLALSDLGEFISGEKELPKKSVVITIDDGYRSYLEVAYPILKKYNFPSTMFVYPDFIGAGRALKWQDITYLSNSPLVDIQSHSKSHDSLSPLPLGESEEDYLARLKIEVEGAEKVLVRKTKQKFNHFAYPYGNSSLRVVELLKQNDYELAVTVHKGSNPSFSAPYLLHRTMIYGGDSLNTFKKSLDVYRTVTLK
ncbi:polysaccharide deacetylase family protein [Paraglaciecola arctica]|uniref:polysaccharide deacetylase family protein n=1 Tax=Paraglaciecola arctica TaxID=1128911 RepID=UPI001C079A7C|nr:polysaccharide deacetylase family protein [Paraglaciecola arctica]MBU3004996.1 polysaccharide deacetylase family protein [Paraglaciecola arctica]